jgi:hypothetical protein
MPVINCKIDVTKILKERLFVGKNGAKYLDITLLPVTNSKYGEDYLCVQSVTKEERLKGMKGPILGNAKIMGTTAHRPTQREEPPEDIQDSSLPF